VRAGCAGLQPIRRPVAERLQPRASFAAHNGSRALACCGTPRCDEFAGRLTKTSCAILAHDGEIAASLCSGRLRALRGPAPGHVAITNCVSRHLPEDSDALLFGLPSEWVWLP
jgi:hypothetical protein